MKSTHEYTGPSIGTFMGVEGVKNGERGVKKGKRSGLRVFKVKRSDRAHTFLVNDKDLRQL